MTDFTEMENYFLLNAAYWMKAHSRCQMFHAEPAHIPNLIREKIVVPGTNRQPCTYWAWTEKGRAQARATAAILGLEAVRELRAEAQAKAEATHPEYFNTPLHN